MNSRSLISGRERASRKVFEIEGIGVADEAVTQRRGTQTGGC